MTYMFEYYVEASISLEESLTLESADFFSIASAGKGRRKDEIRTKEREKKRQTN